MSGVEASRSLSAWRRGSPTLIGWWDSASKRAGCGQLVGFSSSPFRHRTLRQKVTGGVRLPPVNGSPYGAVPPVITVFCSSTEFTPAKNALIILR